MSLIEIATFFRKELKKASNGERVSVQLANFPNGSCEISSVLLGNYLITKGYNVQVVRASKKILDDAYDYEHYKDIGHAWLIVNQKIVDITADQFNDFDITIFISENSKFHSSFNIKSKSFNSSDYVKPEYVQLYQSIISKIN